MMFMAGIGVCLNVFMQSRRKCFDKTEKDRFCFITDFHFTTEKEVG